MSFPPTEVLTLFLATENLWQSVVHCVTTQAPLEGYNQLDTCLWQRYPPFKSLPSSPIFSHNCDSFCLGCKECDHVKTQFNPFSFWLCRLFLVDNIPSETVDSSSAVDGKTAFLYILFPFFPFHFWKVILHMLAGLCGISKKRWEIRPCPQYFAFQWPLSPFCAVLQSWFLIVS